MAMARASAAVIILLALSCAAPSPPPAREVIQNVDLGLELNGLPHGLAVASNQGTSLELRPTDPAKGGVLWFSVGNEQEGVNLVTAVQDHQAQMEGKNGADYKGAQELQGDFGSAFYSRGRYIEDGALTEETVVFMIHPAGNRLLGIHYRYPAGEDSAARVEQLIDVINYVAAIPQPES
jgi:hypothetical protein